MRKNIITDEVIKKRIRENLVKKGGVLPEDVLNTQYSGESAIFYNHKGVRNRFNKWLFEIGTRYADAIKSIPLLSKIADDIYWKLVKEKNSLSIRLKDLLKYEGRAFILNTYNTILMRIPDPGGINYFLNQYKTSARSRVEIIDEILNSVEGKTKEIKIVGLKRALFIERLKRSIKAFPLIGGFIRWLYTTWNISDFVFNMQKLTTRAQFEMEDIHIEFNYLRNEMTSINQKIDSLSDKTKFIEPLRNQIELNKRELTDLIRESNENYNYLRNEMTSINQKIDLLNNKLTGIYKKDLDDYKYYAFENLYRGTREEIKDRQKQYIDRVKRGYEKSRGGYILDAGCGRGEFLELMKEVGIPAIGIDINKDMIEECRKYRLNAEERDIIEYLKEVPNDTLIGVSAFQVVEHLPSGYLSEFISLSYQKIKEGGLIILETINPSSLTAMKHFWMDLSHTRPIPLEALRFLAEAVNFRDVTIKFTSPVPERFRLTGNDENINRLNELLFGYEDYAVIGWK